MKLPITRRQALAAGAAAVGGLASPAWAGPWKTYFQLASFSADVTPPLGHPLMAGAVAAAQRVDDPLYARGLVLLGAGQPVVLAAIDWCEIRNDAQDRWRAALAEAARTTPERVLLASVHQQDAPSADLEAQRLLDERRAPGKICDLPFHERTVQNVARAVRSSLWNPRRITHVGIGQAKVENVASNRHAPGRGRAHTESESAIDPVLKTLSFWNQEFPVAAVSCYAAQPRSSQGNGGISTDFVGLARRRRQAELPDVAQIYLTGCCGNVVAGKENEQSFTNRSVLADRMYRAMTLAWRDTRRRAIKEINYRTVPLRLEPRNTAGYSPEDLQKGLASPATPFDPCRAALGLSWRKRADNGYQFDVPVLDLGVAQLLLLPGDPYVEYQLLAQRFHPESFVVVAGCGDGAPGAIPTERAWQASDPKLSEECWVAPGSEKAMTAALAQALTLGRSGPP